MKKQSSTPVVAQHKIRFHLGMKDVENTNGELSFEPIYSYFEISNEEYLELKNSLLFLRFIEKAERSYEFILDNYHAHEKNIFSIILSKEVNNKDSWYQQHRNYNSFLNTLLNILTSTYLYTCILAIKRKDNDKINEQGEKKYSLSNSLDIKQIYDIKLSFKEITNEYHKTQYQYTFMSALRNKLNHGASLPDGFYTGGYWSVYWDTEKSKDVGFKVKNTDQRFSEIDHKINKSKAKDIIDNKKHYESIKTKMPNEFYLRESIRIYVSLLSKAHADLRENSTGVTEKANSLIEKYLSKSEHEYAYATLIKYENGETQYETTLSPNKKLLQEMCQENKAPLYLEYYGGMPGEHFERKVNNEPVLKRKR